MRGEIIRKTAFFQILVKIESEIDLPILTSPSYLKVLTLASICPLVNDVLTLNTKMKTKRKFVLTVVSVTNFMIFRLRKMLKNKTT